MFNKIKIFYYKLTNNSIIKYRSTGGFSFNFKNKKVYTIIVIIMLLLLLSLMFIYYQMI